MFGIYIAGDSGAYLNPAVTLTNCLFRGFPLRRFPTYAVSQFLGSFFAHGVTYGNYISAFDAYEGSSNRTIPPSPTTTARIFCTFPADEFLSTGNQVFSEFLANFVNLFCIFAMRDENGADLVCCIPAPHASATMIGLLTFSVERRRMVRPCPVLAELRPH